MPFLRRPLVMAGMLALALSQMPEQRPAAQCGPNPIVCENQLPGSPDSEWDINGAGSASIQGFATNISVNKGETVRFKVDTTAPAFNVDIYRLGYYAGLGARKVASILNVTGEDQPGCLTNGGTGLVDCGNWSESTSWAVPSSAVSGLYIAKLTRFDTGGASHVPFVVRDDEGNADILFQTSDTTWHAYNTYGGNSLYVGGPGSNPGRAYKVSYNRPFNTREGTPEDWIFNAEYPTIRYLESNGFNVSYYSGVDTDRYGVSALTRHRIFLSVGHDEYWSGTQRNNVEAARAAGMHLAFFSGNEVFWKIRWESSIDGSNTPYRTLVCYKDTHANAKIDPLPGVWTGTWRDRRFSPPNDGGRPENALMGVAFTVNVSPSTSAIRVTGASRAHPFWRNTRVAALSASGSTNLTAGTLGYEWDEPLNNGFQPSGLTTLSSTTISGLQKLQDNGSTYANGTGTHSLTLYRHASGAWVFAAGTVQWAWALDNQHDRGSAPADLAAQQAIVNLFADMSVAPATLQPGLVPGTPDAQAPISSITAPAQAASLPSGTPLTITGTAADPGGVVASVEVSTNGGTSWTLASGTTSWTLPWTPGAQGLTVIRSRATDSAGNREAPSGGVSVTVTPPVPDTTFPTVLVSSPSSGASAAGTSVTIAANAADNIAVAGVRFQVDGVNVGSEDTSSPFSVTWNTTGVADGVHNLTAIARDAAGNSTTSAPVPVLVVNGAVGPSVDVTATGNRATGATTAVTSAFSTTGGNELLLAFVASDEVGGSPVSVTGITGAGLTWQLVMRTNAQRGTAEIWRAFAPSILTNVTVTAALSQSVSSSIVVVAFKGVDTSGTNGSGAIGAVSSANAPSGAPSASLVAIRAKSLVYGVGIDWDNPTARTLGPNQTMVHQYLSPVGDTYWFQRTTGFTPASGTTVTINDTAPTTDRYNLSIVEVVSTLVADTSFPTVAITTPVNDAAISGTASLIADAADNIGVAGVRFRLDGVDIGTELTASPYTMPWNSTTAANGTHVLTAVARDAAGNTTTSAPVTVSVFNAPPPPDTTVPTVSISAPPAGVVSGSVTVSASANDNVAVASVQFQLNGVALGAADTTNPYSISWNTTTSANGGPYALTAIATDTSGNTATSAPVNVTVSNVASSGLVAAYAFNEGSGTTATDVTGNGRTGTIASATWTGTGRYGSALSFNGTSARVNVADAAALDLTTGMTLEAWVSPAALGSWRTVVLKENGSDLSYGLYANEDVTRPSGWAHVGGSARDAAGSAALPLNTWTHLATTYDGTTLRTYVNGVQVGTRTIAGTIAVSTGAVRIGGNAVWGEYFSGLIDEVRIYNRALSVTEIQTDMATPLGN